MRKIIAAVLTALLTVVMIAGPAHAGATKRCLLIEESTGAVPEATFCLKVWSTQSADNVKIDHMRFWRASDANNVKRVKFRYVVKDEQNDRRYASVVYDKRRKNGPLNFHYYPVQWNGIDAPATVQVRMTVYFKGPYQSTVTDILHAYPVGVDLG